MAIALPTVAGLTMALALAACGLGDADEVAAASPTTAEHGNAATSASATPRYGTPTVVTGSGDITATVEQFRGALGPDNGTG
jgi:hypothetical protein